MTFEPCSARWKEIDRALRRIARRRAALDADEAQWIREALRVEIWLELGMVSMLEYLEARLGYGPRAAQDRIRVALALDELPIIASSLERGALPFTAVRELTRVATPKTEHAWCEAARGKNVHEIEDLISGRRPGDLPSDPERLDLRLRALRFDVRPETFAKLRQIQQVLEDEAGMRLDDDQLVSALCDAVLAPSDRETQRAKSDIPPKTRRFVWQRDGGRCIVPGCRATRHLDVHHVVPRSAGGGHEAQNLVLLCSGHHRALHDGRFVISGRAPDVTVKMQDSADAHVGAKAHRTNSSEAVRDATLALTTAGYSRREAIAAVEAARAHVGVDKIETLLREALRLAAPL